MGSASAGGKAGERPSLPASGHRRRLPRQPSPSASERMGGVGPASPTLAGVQQRGCPGSSWLGHGRAANPPAGAKGYLGSKKPAGVSPALPLPPSPGSGGQPRAASPHKLSPAHPSSRPRSEQPSGAAEMWGAAGHRVWPRQPSHGLPGPGQSCARQGSRLRSGEEGAPPGTRRGRRAGPSAARSAMKGSLTSTIHFPFLAAPANREHVVSAHVFLLQT